MQPALAEIRMFAGNFAPRGWALCEGQLLPINQNQALFSLLGTTYGGDGRTTFALPDMRGRAPIGQGHGPGLSDRRLGAKGGAHETTLNATQLPSHNHTTLVNVSTEDAEETASTGVLGKAAIYNEDPTSGAALGGVSVSHTGNNIAYSNMAPSCAIYYIIALQGVFPSRS